MLEKILADKTLIRSLYMIDRAKELEHMFAGHGYGHARRVSDLCEQILKDIGASEKEIELGKIAGLLHDAACIEQGKKMHAERGAKFAQEYLSKLNMPKEDIKIIADAICYHSNGEVINSNVGAALLLADKIDIGRRRNICESDTAFYKITQKIIYVTLDINEEEINICYGAENDFCIEQLFIWEKALKIPMKAAKYLNRRCIFTVDNNAVDDEIVLTDNFEYLIRITD